MNSPSIPAIAADPAAIEKVRVGQRMIIFFFLLFFGIIILSPIVDYFFIESVANGFLLITGCCCAVLYFVGVLRISSGLGYSVGARILWLLGWFFTPINLILLLALNRKANAALRSAGYKVGSLGAAPNAAKKP